MSRAISYSPAVFNQSSFRASLGTFYRHWFASETLANPDALREIGLGHLHSI